MVEMERNYLEWNDEERSRYLIRIMIIIVIIIIHLRSTGRNGVQKWTRNGATASSAVLLAMKPTCVRQ